MNECSIAYREMVPGDRSFILATWIRSAMQSSGLSKLRFIRLCIPIIEHQLRLDSFRVACAPDAPNTIYGWACYRDSVVQYVYVVKDLRGHGIFESLIGK